MADWSQSGAWMFPGEDGGRERDHALQQRAVARRELRLFMRRLGILLAALDRAGHRGTIGFVVTEGVSVAYAFDWTLDTVTTLGSIPDPHNASAARGQGRPRAVRHRYALLRPGHRRGVLRLRPAQRRARGAPDREDDRLLQRPLHRLRLRPRRPPGRARPARGGRRATSSSTPTRSTATPRWRPGSR